MSTSLARIYAGLYTSGNVFSPNAISQNTFANTSINDLRDVDTKTVSPSLNNTLIWNGTNWVPGSVTVSRDRKSVV